MGGHVCFSGKAGVGGGLEHLDSQEGAVNENYLTFPKVASGICSFKNILFLLTSMLTTSSSWTLHPETLHRGIGYDDNISPIVMGGRGVYSVLTSAGQWEYSF